jgi:hypothetical protein
MIVKQWNMRITGQPKNYRVHLEMDGDADSLDNLRESLRGLLGNIRLTSAEVDIDLVNGESYDAHSLPAHPVEEVPLAGNSTRGGT